MFKNNQQVMIIVHVFTNASRTIWRRTKEYDDLVRDIHYL